jgi:hypothetical protein
MDRKEQTKHMDQGHPMPHNVVINLLACRDQGQSILDSASSIDAHIDASALIDRISGPNAECRLNHWMPTEVVLGICAEPRFWL